MCVGAPTCDQTLAGVPVGQGVDAVGGVWDLVSAVLDGDGVATRHIRHVGHGVRSVSVVADVGLLGLALWVLKAQGFGMSAPARACL